MRRIMLFVSASAWACDSESAVKTVNSVPEVSITSHSDGVVLLEGYTETFRGVVTDNNHGPEELIARWYAGDEPLCDASPPESDGLVQCVVEISSGITSLSTTGSPAVTSTSSSSRIPLTSLKSLSRSQSTQAPASGPASSGRSRSAGT